MEKEEKVDLRKKRKKKMELISSLNEDEKGRNCFEKHLTESVEGWKTARQPEF